jgi:hypothetical protein
MDGKGKYTWKNGDIYEGDFKCNQMHGIGKIVHASGNVWAGEFKYDRKDGKGLIFNSASGDMYKGAWETGILQVKTKDNVTKDTDPSVPETKMY